MKSKTVLTIKGLSKNYNEVKALDNINLSIPDRGITAILGPNGAGKTTCINCICGILSDFKGRISFSNENQQDMQSRLGLCPQELIIWKDLTLIDQLLYMAALFKLPKRSSNKQALSLLDRLGLSPKTHVLAKKLSGGMKRRLNIALSIIHEPDLLILDEPEAGLDPQSRLLVRDFIKQESQERSVILTTHNMDEAERLSDNIVLIDYGRIIEQGTPKSIINKYSCENLEQVFIKLTGHGLRE